MYFEYDGLEKTVRLLAGQNIDAGTVRVWQESGKLYVELQTKDGWKMIDSHVHLADTVDGFPLAGKAITPYRAISIIRNTITWRRATPMRLIYRTSHRASRRD
ncbi:MAG: hypothetical protein ACOX1I_00155 [Dethiobacteria bacterium]